MSDTPVQPSEILMRDALMWDTHSGFMPDPAANLSNLRLWADAGFSYLSIDVGFDLMPWHDTVRTLAVFRHWINAHPETHILASSADDVRRAKAEGKLAVTFDIEGMRALDDRIEMVEFYHRLGVRQMLFAYNRNNSAGGGCHDEDSGLTPFGRRVIDEMNRLGVFVDVSHAGLRTSLEVIDYSDRPVIFSHSNARAIHDHDRNITDEQIRACASSGGVIGAVGVDLFVGRSGPPHERFADQIEYLIDRAGPEHVGLGLDYGFPVDVFGIEEMLIANPQFWPADQGYHDGTIGFVAPLDLRHVVDELLRRGQPERVIRGVLGGNFLRLADEIWK